MPIARVLDFETTGTEPPAKVCEVGICDLDTETKTVAPFQSWLCGVDDMPPEVRAVHHITLAECEGHPAFDQAAADAIMSDGAPAVLVAHNAEFELQFFEPKIPVICTYKSALRAWPGAPSHSNGALRYWLEDQGLIAPDNVLTQPAHRAGPDAYVTAHILLALLNAGHTGRTMVGWTREPRMLPTCPIGKFRGEPWPDVETGFLEWMLRQPTMEDDLKWNADRELSRRNNEGRPND